MYGGDHNTVISWVLLSALELPQLPTDETQVPQTGELDELQTFVGDKKKWWILTAVDHKRPGMRAFVVCYRSSKTFEKLWEQVHDECFWWVSDAYPVYPKFIC